mgnify:CR=1 FL=1
MYSVYAKNVVNMTSISFLKHTMVYIDVLFFFVFINIR